MRLALPSSGELILFALSFRLAFCSKFPSIPNRASVFARLDWLMVLKVTSCTSSIIGMPGKCFLKTALQNGSISHIKTVWNPAHCAANSFPPMPEKRLICVSSNLLPLIALIYPSREGFTFTPVTVKRYCKSNITALTGAASHLQRAKVAKRCPEARLDFAYQ